MADVLERDAGFCSGVDDDDIEGEDGIHSPTDASEDSVDVKVQAISFRNRNKRKCAEPRKLDSELPAKKRKLKSDVDVSSPFRPWSASPPPMHRRFEPRTNLPLKGFEAFGPRSIASEQTTVPTLNSKYLPSGCQYPVQRLSSGLVTDSFSSSGHQEEPLSLVSKRREEDRCEEAARTIRSNLPTPTSKPSGDTSQGGRIPVTSPTWYPLAKDLSQASQSPASEGRTNDRGCYLTNKVKMNNFKTHTEKKCKPETKTKTDEVSGSSDNKFGIDSLLSCGKTEGSSRASTSKSSQGGQQRNYKNMTRERRIEANARERTRVHTISAAFDTLRYSIPAYSHNQKLSKLSVLRIACSYIMTLSRLAGHDYSKDQSEPDLSSCVDNVSRTIQTEGKIRKKRED